MTQASGANSQLVIDFETTFGADPSSVAGLKMPFNTCNLVGSQAKNTPGTITGRRSPTRPFAGNVDAAGPIVIPVDYIAMFYWLKAMFGDPTSTGSGPYAHEFKIGSTMNSLVVEKGFTDITQYWKYNGIMITGFNLSVGGDGELTMTLNTAGSHENTPGATPYDASPTEIGLGRLDNFEANIDEGGSESSEMVSFNLNVDFGLDLNQRLIGGSGRRAGIPVGIVKVEGSLEAIYQDNTLVTKGVNSTETSLRLEIINGTNELDFYLPEVELSRPETPIEGPQGIRQKANFHGYYEDDAAASALVATLTNGYPVTTAAPTTT